MMTLKREAGLIKSEEYLLHCHYQEPALWDTRALVVFSHGFSVDGTESHRMFNDLALAYNDAGIASLQFDYRGCGYSSGDFSAFTVSGAIADIGAVVAWARRMHGPEHLFLHGQSLGSAVASLATGRQTEPTGLVLWNLSAEIESRYPRLFGSGILTEDRYCLSDKGLITGRVFMEDAATYDVLGAFPEIGQPVLFVNAGADEKSSAAYAEEAATRLAHDRYEVVEIPGANHSFKCQADLQELAAARSVEWVSKLIDG